MVNLEHKLTVDDLIVEYMMYKVENGYEPSFTTAEFINFLYFFESKMKVEDVSYINDELFKRFFERKSKGDWSTPHMEMEYSEKYQDNLIKANYKLGNFDKSIINTYFMDNGMSKFEHYKGQAFKIRNIIGEWLSNYPKRTIDQNIEVDHMYLLMGKYLAAEITDIIWKSYV